MRFQRPKNLLSPILFLAYLSALIPTHDFQQHGYYIKSEHCVLTNVSHDVFEYAYVKNSWFNRTTRTFDCFLKTKLTIGTNVTCDFKPFIFVSNQYKYFAPLHLSVDVCKMFDGNLFGMKVMLEKSNLTLCPLKAGRYFIKNFTPKDEAFPPFIPAGKYRNLLTFRYNNAVIFIADWYGQIIQRL